MEDRAKAMIAYYASNKVTVDQLEILILSCKSRMERCATSEAYAEDAFLLQCMEHAMDLKEQRVGA